jgi:hypothetical protein
VRNSNSGSGGVLLLFLIRMAGDVKRIFLIYVCSDDQQQQQQL